MKDIAPKSIVQAYRLANEEIENPKSPEQKIRAASRFIEFCRKSETCRLDNSIKRNQLLFWSYVRRAKAYLDKNRDGFDGGKMRENCVQALMNYSDALGVAVNQSDAYTVLDRMALLCERLGDFDNVIEIRLQEAALLPAEERYDLYVCLAEAATTDEAKVRIWEKALLAVNDRQVSLAAKCRNITDICERLAEIYNRSGDAENLRRVSVLKADAEEILLQAGE